MKFGGIVDYPTHPLDEGTFCFENRITDVLKIQVKKNKLLAQHFPQRIQRGCLSILPPTVDGNVFPVIDELLYLSNSFGKICI